MGAVRLISRIMALVFVAAMAIVLCTFQQAQADEDLMANGENVVLKPQNAGTDYSFENETILVRSVTQGTVSYDGTTKTLTLKDVAANDISISTDTTVRIVGSFSLATEGISSLDFIESKVDIVCENCATNTSFTCKNFTMSGGMASGYVNCDTFTLKEGTVNGDVSCEALNMNAGTITGSANCVALDMTGGKVKGEVICTGSFNMRDGTIDGLVHGFMERPLSGTMDGGTVTEGVTNFSYFTMRGGLITGTVAAGDTFTMHGGKIQPKDNDSSAVDCSKFNMLKGTIVHNSDCQDAVVCFDFTMKGGSIIHNLKKPSAYSVKTIVCNGAFYMSGGTIKSTNCSEGIEISTIKKNQNDAVIKGGTIAITSPNGLAGIFIANSNLKMNGGTIKISRAQNTTYGGLYCGVLFEKTKNVGKVSISKGSITISGGSINCSSMTNNAVSLKRCSGYLPYGASFIAGSNTFKTLSKQTGLKFAGSSESLILVKFDAKSKKANFKTFSHWGIKYEVNKIASKAFNTKYGKKVTEASFQGISEIGSRAFYGAKKLKKLRFSSIPLMAKRNKAGKIVSISPYAKSSLSKTSFTGLNKHAIVQIGGISEDDTLAYKKCLMKYGLPKSAKVVAGK